jgi:hypothetical protein
VTVTTAALIGSFSLTLESEWRKVDGRRGAESPVKDGLLLFSQLIIVVHKNKQ